MIRHARPMARPWRIELAGGRYDVTARGNERRPIFRDDSDRQRFLEVSAIASGSTGGIGAAAICSKAALRRW